MIKKSLIFFLFILPFFLFSKEKIVILELKAMEGVSPKLANSITEILITSIANQGKYQVLERSQLDKIFKEMSLTGHDDFDDSTAIEIGKLAKAKLVLIGSLTKLGGRYAISARGIDIETGNITFGQSVFADSVDELFEKTIELSAIISGTKQTPLTPASSEKEIYNAAFTTSHKDFPEIEEFPFVAYYEDGKYMIERKKGKDWFSLISIPLKMNYSKDFEISFRLYYSYGNFVLMFGAEGSGTYSNAHFLSISNGWFEYGVYENRAKILLVSNMVSTDNKGGTEVKLVKEQNTIKIYFNNTLYGSTHFKQEYGPTLLLLADGRSKVGLEYLKVEYK